MPQFDTTIGKESKTTGRDEKNADYKSSSETVHVFTTSLDSSFRETSEYTHLACSSSEQAAGFSASSTVYSPQVVVKQEPPDDYWLMRNDYIDKDRSSSSLQVNVKTECFMTSDEVGGQTLRISCTKPEDIDSSSNGPTALRSDVKPDIVLKVKPRSSSLLTLARAASDFYIASKKDAENSVKPESNSEDVKPSFSPTYSAPVLTPETDRSFCHTSVSTDDSFGESSHPKLSMILKEAHPDTAGEYPGNDQTTDSKISLQQLEPVLEESTLPPVANTVELLTEPHDYLHGNLNHCNVTLNGSERQARLDGYESDSPGPPVLEPITLIKTEPAEYLDETSGTLGIKQEVKQDWNERDKEDEAMMIKTTTMILMMTMCSENRRGMQQQHPDATCNEVEQLLSVQWREVTFSSKVHFLCRARDAGTDHDRHTVRKKKGDVVARDDDDDDDDDVLYSRQA
nr:hypothetical protein BaRGS_030703 [Batillaria attramentaria]